LDRRYFVTQDPLEKSSDRFAGKQFGEFLSQPTLGRESYH
jgi:hypothetical protein